MDDEENSRRALEYSSAEREKGRRAAQNDGAERR